MLNIAFITNFVALFFFCIFVVLLHLHVLKKLCSFSLQFFLSGKLTLGGDMQTNVFHYDSCGESIVKTQDFKCFNIQLLPIVLQNILIFTSTCNSGDQLGGAGVEI